ncbi:helix-turn-helix transcriptional regulator [Acetobacterium tundrae]|uniref:Helix-turn-helix domain-containing protein n=1 Tax=Acetobacterium tundrae TaxID=132932 RepID=A0ABR6WJ02_9FIRM|nr:helix-turn-helix transcriptional regulator [Acetobacterium tundrae]MBC3796464.1 helix-turn-helix domain-containing protein [Acetobacterium tundrae]
MNAIEQFRTNKKITQEKMATDLSVSQSAVAQWESGKRVPPLKKAKEIADYFDTTIEIIFFDEEYNTMLEKCKAS